MAEKKVKLNELGLTKEDYKGQKSTKRRTGFER